MWNFDTNWTFIWLTTATVNLHPIKDWKSSTNILEIFWKLIFYMEPPSVIYQRLCRKCAILQAYTDLRKCLHQVSDASIKIFICISPAGSHFYGTEYEIWACFGPVCSTEIFRLGLKVCYFWVQFFMFSLAKKNIFKEVA